MSDPLDPTADLRQHLARASNCSAHPPIRVAQSIEEAELWVETFDHCPEHARTDHLRWLARNDLFFLLVFLLHRWHLIGDKEPFHPRESKKAREARHRARDWRKATWAFARCREVQADPYNWLDIWSREHCKSEILTFGANIQAVLIDPNETVGIFAHTRPIAKQFLRLIKMELERNEELKDLFPDIFWREPERESPKWSENDGITVRRTSNRKESTFEAWGLIDGQPTSKRYTILDYDDVISRKEITDTMIPKVTEEFDNSLLLSASDPIRFRYAATFQEINDTTQQLIDRGYRVRMRYAYDQNNEPTFFSPEKLADFKQKLSPKVFALQILLDPRAAQSENHIGFDLEWIAKAKFNPADNVGKLNVYILVDPAGKSKESNSHFALWVVGLSADQRIRLLDAVYDKLDLAGRTAVLKTKVLQWSPLKVAYEKHAMQADAEHIRIEMRREGWECFIVDVGDTNLSKDQRIEMLIPDFRDGRILLPESGIRYRPQNGQLAGKEIDIVKLFIEREYSRWPFSAEYKDLLDALSRIKDPKLAAVFPRRYNAQAGETTVGWGQNFGDSGGWMAG